MAHLVRVVVEGIGREGRGREGRGREGRGREGRGREGREEREGEEREWEVRRREGGEVREGEHNTKSLYPTQDCKKADFREVCSREKQDLVPTPLVCAP